jgi:hypothetical protein
VTGIIMDEVYINIYILQQKRAENSLSEEFRHAPVARGRRTGFFWRGGASVADATPTEVRSIRAASSARSASLGVDDPSGGLLMPFRRQRPECVRETPYATLAGFRCAAAATEEKQDGHWQQHGDSLPPPSALFKFRRFHLLYQDLP